MEIVISIPEWVIGYFSDLLLTYLCIGSLALFPWGIYRASRNRCRTYYHALSIKGCWLFIAIWLLWPRAIYGMIKEW